MLNKAKLHSEDTNANETSPGRKEADDRAGVLEPFENELNCPLFGQLSNCLNCVNDNPEMFNDGGNPTCLQRSGYLESEIPTNSKSTNTMLYEEFESPRSTTNASVADIDDVWLCHFPGDDDPAIDNLRPINFVSSVDVADEVENLEDFWGVKEDSTETLNESDMESGNTSKETDSSGMLLFEGAKITLGVSMLLVITFAMRHSITGVALADLLLLIELHLISPNCFGHSMKLLRNFFKQLRNPIEYHYYCSFCFEYIGAKEHSGHCTNKHCLQDFSKRGSLCYFIVVPLIAQLQSLLASKYDINLSFTNLSCNFIYLTRVALIISVCLRADACKYQPEVCNSEKFKILKKIHNIAHAKLLQEIHVLLRSDNYF